MSIGEIIKQFRERQGMSQRKFAARCGLSNNYISILESGINPNTGLPTKPSLDALKSIASVMSMTLDELLDMIDDDTIVSLDSDDVERKAYVQEMTVKLRENPKLRLLFDKTSKMSDKDMDAVLGIVNALLRENDDD